jgi:flagellar hook-associated protein FlgK
MSDLLSIAGSGVSAYQQALTTISNNIANVSTEGYAREDISLAESDPQQIGTTFLGTGTRFENVKRQYDAFLSSNLRNSNSDLQAQGPMVTYTNRLVDILGDSNIGLTSSLNQFFSSAQDLASDPASQVTRNSFLTQSNNLASNFRQISAQIASLDTETSQSIQTDIGQVNALTKQLAEINQQMLKVPIEANQPSQLVDQRDLLLKQLSNLVGIKTQFSTNGSVLVSVGDTIDQGVLVNGTNSQSIQVSNKADNPGQFEFDIYPNGVKSEISSFSSGKISGEVNFKSQVLQPTSGSLDSLATEFANQVNKINSSGIDLQGNVGGNLFGFTPGMENTAAGLKLLTQNPNLIATAGQFRVTNNSLNTGTAQATVAFGTPDYTTATDFAGSLGQAQVPFLGSATVNFSASGVQQVATIPAGTQDFNLSLNQAQDGQSLVVMTRDKNYLIGPSASSVNSSNLNVGAFASGSQYENGATLSQQYLNQNNTSGSYMGMDLFYGAKAQPIQTVNFDIQHNATTQVGPAVLVGSAVDASATLVASNSSHGVAYSVNGHEIDVQPGDTIASFQNAVNSAQITSSDGKFVLQASLNPVANSNNGQVQLQLSWSPVNTGSNAVDTTDDIRIGFQQPAAGSSGLDAASPSDLLKLGFNTSLSIKGKAPDDLLIYAVGNPGSSAQLTDQYSSLGSDSQQLMRQNTYQIQFAPGVQSPLQYQIIDTASKSVLATRTLDPSISVPVIDFRGLQITLSSQPQPGDSFTIDGNKDGVGDNANMLQMVALQNKALGADGQTLSENYLSTVNTVGSIAKQATISQQALQVVYNQANQSNDNVSGVSMDQEATALVKFQQAYQANAKVMQIATQLFSSILQIQ